MFWIIWDPFGPVWTLLNNFKQKLVFAQKHLRQTQLYPYEATNWFLSEKVQKCPDGPKRVPNCQKHLLPLRTPWTPLDHSGMLTSLRCATIFVSFIGAFFWDTQYLFHFFFGNFRKVDPRAPTDEYTYVVSLFSIRTNHWSDGNRRTISWHTWKAQHRPRYEKDRRERWERPREKASSSVVRPSGRD